MDVIDGEVVDLTPPPKPVLTKRVRRRGSRTIPRSEKQLAVYEKTKTALKMRARGVPYRDIAKALGYKSAATVHEAVQRLLDDYDVESDIAEYRRLEMERLELYERELMAIVAKGGRAAPRAIEVAMKLMERRSKLLGLDAAEQHEVTVNAPTFYDYERDPRQEERQRRVAALLGDTAS